MEAQYTLSTIILRAIYTHTVPITDQIEMLRQFHRR